MALYTIFGAAAPTTLSFSGTLPQPYAFSTAFYGLGLTDWEITGVRIFMPTIAPAPASPMKAYLWGGATGASTSPDTMLATVDFVGFTAGAWNSATFTTPIPLVSGTKYWAQVWIDGGGVGEQNFKFTSSGAIISVEGVPIYAAGKTEVSTGQGSYIAGVAGQAPAFHSNDAWYGIDVIVNSPEAVNQDSLPIRDDATAVRSGLPATVGASATVTDPLGLNASDTTTFPVGGATQFHTNQRYFNEVRSSWGPVTNLTVRGPLPSIWFDGATTMGMEFTVQWPVRFIGGKMYKHPLLAGSIPIRFWDHQGTAGAARELGNVTLTFVADGGGWREFTFPAPIELTPGVKYIISYYSPNGYYVLSDYVFYWWPEVQPPFVVQYYQDIGGVLSGGGIKHTGGGSGMIPDIYVPANYYLDPLVEWDSEAPVYVTGSDYYSQWVNGVPSHPFMIGMFWADPQNIQPYFDMGINTLIGAYSDVATIAAVKATGAPGTGMDHYPFAGTGIDPTKSALRAVAEDPTYAGHVKGYYIVDEPDQFFPYSPPSTVRSWMRDVRFVDSTRPLVIGMGKVVGTNATFHHQPQGSNMIEANQLWREWGQLPDILDGDAYTLTDDQDTTNTGGVWTYDTFTRRIRSLNEGRTPIWNDVETCAPQGRADQPVPHEVRKAVWASLIAGANGIVYFDHRFQNPQAAQDFAAMLHTPAMKAEVTALNTRVQSLADALNSPDTNIVTAWTSSNTTDGPLGGTFGVPMHYCTKDDGTHEYLFAMGIRPGGTTATFTIPSWAGATITVIDESRTVVVSGAGVLTDTFAADYTVHLYQKS